MIANLTANHLQGHFYTMSRCSWAPTQTTSLSQVRQAITF